MMASKISEFAIFCTNYLPKYKTQITKEQFIELLETQTIQLPTRKRLQRIWIVK